MEQYKHLPSGKIFKRKTLNGDGLDNFVEVDNPQLEIPHYLVQGKDWELIKDYTILYFEKSGRKYTNDVDKHYHLRGDFSIYSVVRESDGEVFILEDEYPLVTGGKTKIKEFKIVDNTICINTYSGHVIFLDSWRKPERKKLFTTTDNVDIYEGDEHWFINQTNWSYFKGHKDSTYQKQYQESLPSFSTVKAAMEYLYQNKPCLSYIDIVEKFKPNSINNIVIRKEILEDFIKSKFY